MTASELRDRIGGAWSRRADGWWLELEPGRVRDAVRASVEAEARFSAIVACPQPDGSMRVSWHWDLGGTLLSVRASIDAGAAAPGIADLCPAADWAEREAADYYAITFEGRVSTPPLVLREGDRRGMMW